MSGQIPSARRSEPPCSGVEPTITGVDVRAGRKPEGAERDGEGDVQGRRRRRVPETEALVRDVTRVRGGAQDPRRPAPRPHVGGRQREQDADEGVPDADEDGGANPRRTRRFALRHAVGDGP